MGRGAVREQVLLLLASLLWVGCVGGQVAGSGGGMWALESPHEEARRAEVESALEHFWSLSSGHREVGARLAFTFWAQNGALTLLEYLSGRAGVVVLTLKREEAGWAVDSEATARGGRPPEAKTQPVNRRSLPADTVSRAQEVASKLVRLVEVPAGGATSLRVEVGLEDDRIVGWEHRGFQVMERGGGLRALSDESVERLARVLLPFVQGVGRRTLALELRGEHRVGAPTAHVQVLAARTLHPVPLPGEDPDFAAEYRAMHEDILCRWREGVRDGAELLARYSLEEMALWCVGGMLTRGAGLLFESAAPTVTRVLTRGGTEAAGWLRTTLFRLSKVERKAFDRLWMKVRMEGAEALSAAEKNELLALMNRLERLIKTPLTDPERDRLRDAARRYFQKAQPRLELAMGLKGPYEMHHRRPLEYAHLFSDADINAEANLKAVGREVHQHISNVWTEFRKIRGDASRAEVERVVSIIDGHFARWYENPYSPGEATRALDVASSAAKQEVRRIFSSP
ncbi:hypothetical protein [Archangium sp.]|uniref:hypothetical protein n=1 Tax=Archangium sp. TaxID=1872627 RepID=UPI00286CA2CB|nr:hypothetical protein [Archangium sp.]